MGWDGVGQENWRQERGEVDGDGHGRESEGDMGFSGDESGSRQGWEAQ